MSHHRSVKSAALRRNDSQAMISDQLTSERYTEKRGDRKWSAHASCVRGSARRRVGGGGDTPAGGLADAEPHDSGISPAC
jgi:hypothetical protein